MNKLEILKIRFCAICKETAKLRYNMGNTYRGAFGNTLTWLYSSSKKSTNLYDIIFKNTSSKVHYDNMFCGKPNPLIIEADNLENLYTNKGDTIEFSFVLIGNACEFAKEVITAVSLMLQGNIAGNINCFELVSAENYYTKEVYFERGQFLEEIKVWEWSDNPVDIDGEQDVIIKFTQPVQIKLESKILKDNLPFYVLIKSILGRLTLLCSAYGKEDFSVDVEKLIEKAKEVKVKNSSLKSCRFDVYSRTTDEKISMNAMTGSITYSGNMQMFLPYINIGSVLHVGNQTTKGLGGYLWKFNE